MFKEAKKMSHKFCQDLHWADPVTIGSLRWLTNGFAIGYFIRRYGESLYILRGVLDSVTSGFTNEFQLQQVSQIANT